MFNICVGPPPRLVGGLLQLIPHCLYNVLCSVWCVGGCVHGVVGPVSLMNSVYVCVWQVWSDRETRTKYS